ncbi:T9SS type A sorting domain-containing protein, partial [Candidatus Poribacteria bacterium]|nr:T9SS type A sorting domain-containing protein [Candidatus Poribacteria bacterium]
KLWDVETHENIATLEGHRSGISSVAFSPDGTLLASGSYDETVKLWDVETHENIATLEGHRWIVTSVAFSPDGTLLASGSDYVKLWDVETKRNIYSKQGSGSYIRVAFSPDGELFAYGDDFTVNLQDKSTGTHITTFEGHEWIVTSVAFSPDGTLLASGSGDGTVKLWNINVTIQIISGNGQEAPANTQLTEPFVVEVRDSNDNPLPNAQVTFTLARGDRLLIGESTPVEVTTDANGRAAQTLTLGPKPGINIVEVSMWNESVWFEVEGVSPYQLVKISGDEQQGTFGTTLASPLVVEVRDPNNNPLPDVQVTFTVTEGEGLLNGESIVVKVTTDANGRAAQTLTLGHAATNTVDASIGYEWVEFNAAGISPEHIATLPAGDPDNLISVAFSPDGNTLASADVTGVKLWDVATKENTITLAVERSGKSVAFSPDGILLAFGTGTNIKLWNTMTNENVATLEGHGDDVISIAFSPDGKTLASGAWDGIVKLWDVATKENIATFGGHITAILEGWFSGFHTPVSFSPDGTRLAFGAGISIKLWDVTANENVAILEGHEDGVISIAFSPDGTLLASTGRGSFEREVKLWDVATKENTITLEMDWGAGVATVAFSPDGTTLAFGTEHSIKLWDMTTNGDIHTLEGHEDTVYSVVFSPDGNTLASASRDGTVKLWDVSSSIIPIVVPPEFLAEDVNGDGSVNIQDLVLVAANLGQAGQNTADVNSDGVVDIRDLVKVAGALGNAAAAPSLNPQALSTLTTADVKQWLSEAQQMNLTDAASQRGIQFLEQLLAALTPKKTALLANFPNPFNPETWIPYHLAKDADITLTIYAIDGQVVRKLALGHQPAGMYQNRSRAAYWDGRNAFGEPVASGVYFYTLTAGDFSATRKMLIRK